VDDLAIFFMQKKKISCHGKNSETHGEEKMERPPTSHQRNKSHCVKHVERHPGQAWIPM